MDYECYRCGNGFVVWQAQAGRDEDIDVCWACIDSLFQKTM